MHVIIFLPSIDKVLCEYLEAPAHGSINQIDRTVGSTATYSCDHGFKLKGNEQRECLYDGTWSGDDPVCIPSKLDEI